MMTSTSTLEDVDDERTEMKEEQEQAHEQEQHHVPPIKLTEARPYQTAGRTEGTTTTTTADDDDENNHKIAATSCSPSLDISSKQSDAVLVVTTPKNNTNHIISTTTTTATETTAAEIEEEEIDILPSVTFEPGDHITRWEMLPILWPIQIHGIVLNVFEDTVILVDFGLSAVNNKKEAVSANQETASAFAAQHSLMVNNTHATATTAEKNDLSSSSTTSSIPTWMRNSVMDPKKIEQAMRNVKIGGKKQEKNRLNIHVLSDPKDICKWKKVDYESTFFGFGGTTSNNNNNSSEGANNNEPDEETTTEGMNNPGSGVSSASPKERSITSFFGEGKEGATASSSSSPPTNKGWLSKMKSSLSYNNTKDNDGSSTDVGTSASRSEQPQSATTVSELNEIEASLQDIMDHQKGKKAQAQAAEETTRKKSTTTTKLGDGHLLKAGWSKLFNSNSNSSKDNNSDRVVANNDVNATGSEVETTTTSMHYRPVPCRNDGSSSSSLPYLGVREEEDRSSEYTTTLTTTTKEASNNNDDETDTETVVITNTTSTSCSTSSSSSSRSEERNRTAPGGGVEESKEEAPLEEEEDKFVVPAVTSKENTEISTTGHHRAKMNPAMTKLMKKNKEVSKPLSTTTTTTRNSVILSKIFGKKGVQEDPEKGADDDSVLLQEQEKEQQQQQKWLKSLPKADPSVLVLARTHWLLANGESILPNYHAFSSNSECLAVFCKTGHWSTIQTDVFLHSTAIGNAKTMGVTTMAVAASAPLLAPVVGVAGLAAVGLPWWYLSKQKKSATKKNQLLSDEFWAQAEPAVFIACIQAWSKLGITVVVDDEDNDNDNNNNNNNDNDHNESDIHNDNDNNNE